MSIGSIYVDLLLNDGRFSAGWGRARGSARTAVGAIQGDISKLSGSISALVNPLAGVTAAFRQLGASVAAVLSVEKVIKYSDTWRQTTGRLSLVASGMDEVVTRQEQLFRIAQETRQPLNDVMSFYTRLNQFIPETERKQYDLLGVTQSVASALAITGESAISAQAALIQFTQGIGTNFEAAGQELRSLQELAPRLTQALQKALGDGTQSLQQLVKVGKLTRESVLNALGGMGVEGRKLKDEMAKIPTTVSQAFTQLDNALLKFLGTSNSVSNSTSALATAIKFLADNLETLARAFIAVAAVVGGASLLKFASSATKAGIALAMNADKAAKAAAAYSAFRTAGTAVAGATKAFTLSGAIIKTAETAALGLRGAFLGLSATLGGPLVLAAVGAAAALAIFADKNKAIAGEEALRKAVSDTASEFAGYASQTEASQQQVVKAYDERIAKTKEETRAIEDLYIKRRELSWFGKALSGTIGTLGAWVGKDFSAADPFGVGYAEGQLLELLTAGRDSVTQMKAIRKEAEGLIETGATGFKFTADQLKEFAKVGDKYKAVIKGISEARLSFETARDEAFGALTAGVIDLPAYDAILRELKQKLYESSPEFKAAQKNAEELKAIYERFRPAILGVTKAQDEYNQAMAEAGRLRASGKIDEEAYLRIKQQETDILNDTEGKAKENQSIYDKYETYLTGITEKQLDYNRARKELQDLVGKKTESGAIVTQTQADTALDKYRQHLEDSKGDMLEWGTFISNMGRKAAENIQDSFAEFLYDPFKGGLDGMVTGFQNAIRKMAADLLASQLFKLLAGGLFKDESAVINTGKAAVSGAASSGGFWSSIASLFGGAKAEGGFLAPGTWGVVGEKGAEIVYGGNTGATVIPQDKLRSSGGSTILNMNIYASDVDSFNRSRKQLAASGMQMLEMASQRNG